MTLLELCEPLFQYVCRLNRSARKEAVVEHNQVRAEIEAILNDIETKAGPDPRLANQLDPDKGKIGPVLSFFVDFIIKESRLSFASDWQEIAAKKYNALAGDQKFWDLLEETLNDRSEAADERLLVYYVCIGLGFTGLYSDQPEHLRAKMREISIRIRHLIDSDDTVPLISESELHVNLDNLIEPPGKSLVGIAIALVGLLIVLFVGNIVLYWNSTSDLDESLNTIIEMRETSARSSSRSEQERLTQQTVTREGPSS